MALPCGCAALTFGPSFLAARLGLSKIILRPYNCDKLSQIGAPLLYVRTVLVMEAPSAAELKLLAASADRQAGEVVVHWQSPFGLIVIEVRSGQVYVNGDLVEPHS